MIQISWFIICLRFRALLKSGINTQVNKRFTFVDGSHNILEVTESIFVAGGCQIYLWPEDKIFTNAHVLEKSRTNGYYSLYSPDPARDTSYYVSIYNVKIYEAFGYTEPWWPLVANR